MSQVEQIKPVAKPHPHVVPSAQVERHDLDIVHHPRVLNLVPRTAEPYNQQRQTEIYIDSETELLDGFSSFLEFQVAADADQFNLDGSAHSYIQSIELQARNGARLDIIDDHNLIHNMLWQCQADPDRGTREWASGADEYLLGETAKTDITTTKRRYCIHLMFSLFNRGHHLHLPALGGVKMVIRWAPVGIAGSSHDSGSSPASGYSVTDVVFHARLIPMSPKYLDELHKFSASGRLVYNPKAWASNSAVYTGNSGSASILRQLASVTRAFVVHRQVTDVAESLPTATVATDGARGLTRYMPPNTVGSAYSQQFQHGSARFPEQPINSAEVAFFHLENALGQHRDLNVGGTYLTKARYAPTGAPTDLADSELYVVGYDMTRSGKNTGLSLSTSPLVYNFSATSARSGQQITLIIEFDQLIQVLAPNNIRVAH